MNKIAVISGSYAALVAALLIAFPGCGGLECAEGTVEQDGECVLEAAPPECEQNEVLYGGQCEDPAEIFCTGEDLSYDAASGTCVADVEEISCGANTEPSNGECVAAEATECGPNSELDVNSNTCVVTDQVCGDNTVFSEETERCAPAAEVCDDGTEYSEEAGLCLPDARCQSGDVILDGYCVSPAEELAADAEFVADGNTDPGYGGTPVDLTAENPGDEAIFKGTIDGPSDLDEDGSLNQHIDYFHFDAEAGDWFEIAVHSTGIPSPAFSIIEDTGEGLRVLRYSSIGTTRDKVRQFVAPDDGDYFVAVGPEAGLVASLSQDEDLEGTVGSDDWDYVGTLTHLEAPDATDHDFGEEELEGTLGRLDDNFFAVDAEDYEEGDYVRIEWEETPSDATPIIQVWNSPTDFYGETLFDSQNPETSVLVPISDADEFWVIADWRIIQGTEVDYRLSADKVPVLDANSEQETTFDADDGDVLQIQQTNADDADVEVTVSDDTGAPVVDTTTLEATDGDAVQYLGLEAGDEYTVTFENTTEDDIFDFQPSISVLSPIEADTFNADDGEWYEISHENDDSEPVHLIVTDDDGEIVADGYVEEGETITVEIEEDGEYTVSYFRFGVAQGDQELDGFEVTIDEYFPG